jgi:hypothetical protein
MELPILIAMDTTENWNVSDTALGESELAIEIAGNDENGKDIKHLLVGDGNAVGPNVERLRAKPEIIASLPAWQQQIDSLLAEEQAARIAGDNERYTKPEVDQLLAVEEAARIAGDNERYTKAEAGQMLAAEEAARVAGDNERYTKAEAGQMLAAEEAARIAGDNERYTKEEAGQLLQAEEAARVAGDEALDEKIADTVAASQTWLPAVAEAGDLPAEVPDTNRTYLCRVTALNNVYQRVAGEGSAWALYSSNTDYIDETELAAAVEAEASRAQAAEEALGEQITDEALARIAGDEALDERIADMEAASQTWLPAVAEAGDLPAAVPDTNRTYLCQVTAENNVYQRVAGEGSAWALYSSNASYITETELAAAVEAEASRAQAAEEALGEQLNEEAAARIAGEEALGEQLNEEALARIAGDAALDEKIADTVAASQTWLPAAAEAGDLPAEVPDTNRTYLCRVTAENNVYQRVAGEGSAWALYSSNTDYIDETELAAAVGAEAAARVAGDAARYTKAEVNALIAGHKTIGIYDAESTAETASLSNPTYLCLYPEEV